MMNEMNELMMGELMKSRWEIMVMENSVVTGRTDGGQ